MSTSAIRVNARLTGDDARRFKELQALEKRSSSDVLRAAVREYHAKRVKPRKSSYQLLVESGLIGCIEGSPDSSSPESIRQAMDEALRAKYPRQGRAKP